MKKKIILGFFGTILIGCYSNITFACNSCNQTPEKVQKYISNMKSAMSSLTSPSGTSSSGGGYSGPGSSIWSKIVTTSESAYDSVFAGINYSKNMTAGFAGDMFANFRVVFNSDSAIRDRKKIIALDKTLGDKIYKLSKKGNFRETIPQDQLSKLSGKIKDLGPISLVEIKNGATYGEVAAVLWDIQALYKNMYMEFSNTNRRKQDHRENVMKIQKKYEEIMNIEAQASNLYDYVDGLQQEYECSTTQNKCPGGFEEFKKDIKSIMKFSMKDVTKAIDKFKESYEELKEALLKLSGGNGDLTKSFESKKKELLSRYYGGKAKEIVNFTGTWGVGKARQQLKEEIVDPAKNIVESVDEKTIKTNKTPQNVKDSKVEVGIFGDKQIIERFKQSGRNTIETIYNIQDTKQTDTVIQSPGPITSMFPDLSKEVYTGVNYIGDQDKDGSIVKNMGEACDKQCSNKGGKCRDDGKDEDLEAEFGF